MFKYIYMPFLCLFSLISFAGSRPKPVVVDIGKNYYKPSEQYVTPHIAWAKPYRDGKLKVLFIALNMRMRESVEFAQRLDIDFKYANLKVRNGKGMFDPGYFRKGHYLGDEPGDKLNRLNKFIEKDYDLYVIGDINWKYLPENVRKKILESIKNGAGLIKVSSGIAENYSGKDLDAAAAKRVEIPERVIEGVPWKFLPVFENWKNAKDLLKGEFKAASYGKGKIIQIVGYQIPDQQIITPGFSRKPLWHRWNHFWFRWGFNKTKHRELDLPITEIKRVNYDYYMQFMIRVMLYAANRTPEAVVANPGKVVKIKFADSNNIVFPIASSGKIPGAILECKVRDRDNYVMAEKQKIHTIAAGKQNISFELNRKLPNGKYFADLWIKNAKGEVAGFGTIPLQITSDNKILSASLNRNSFKKNETVTGNIKINIKNNLYIEILHKDSFKRLISRRKLNISGNNLKFFLPPENPLAVWQFLELRLTDGVNVYDRKKLAYTISDLYLEDTIRLGVWQWSFMSYLTFSLYERLYELGFDSVGRFYSSHPPTSHYYLLEPEVESRLGRAEMATMANLRYIPPIMRITDSGIYAKGKVYFGTGKNDFIKKQDNVRYPCLNDEKYLRLAKDRCRTIVNRFSPQSTSDYFFDQEPCLSQSWHRKHIGVCYCPLCKNYFRKYLKCQYKTIAAVNREYGTSWKNFSEVEPPMLKDLSVKNANLAPCWADFRLAMCGIYSGFYEKLTKTINNIQPNAKTGIAAPISFGFRAVEGMDLWQFSKWMKLKFPYYSFTQRVLNSFAQKDSLLGQGTTWGPARARSREHAYWMAWNNLFTGNNFSYLYHGDTGFATTIANDYTVFKDLKHYIEQNLRIKSGIGKLIHEATPDNGGIAVLYSISSVMNWPLLEKFGKVDNIGYKRYGKIGSEALRVNYGNWSQILKQSNVPCNFVAYEQVASGILSKGDYRVLILPMSTALSPAEIREIKKFVKNGGIVIADVAPGIADQHCKPFAASPLDEVFGVGQNTGNPQIEEAMITLAEDSEFRPKSLGISRASVSLKVTTGKANGMINGKIPLLIINRYGKGKGILLNFTLDGYYSLISIKRSDPTLTKKSEKLRNFIHNLFTNTVKVLPAKMSPELPLATCYVFKEGDNRYLGVLQDLPEPWTKYAAKTSKPLEYHKTTLSFPDKAHIYDMLTGKYLGYENKISTEIKVIEPKLYSLLNYTVDDLELSCPGSIKQGKTLNYKVVLKTSKKPERHVFRVSMISPENKEIRHYSGNVNCLQGKYSGKINLALNDSPGQYTLRIKDIATGMTAKKKFLVEK